MGEDRPTRRMWTRREELEAVRLYRDAGHKLAVVANRLGRTLASVKGKMQALRVVVRPDMKPRRKPGAQFRAAAKRLRAGQTVGQVAMGLGVDHACISRIRARLGLPAATRSERVSSSWAFRAARGDIVPNPWEHGRKRGGNDAV